MSDAELVPACGVITSRWQLLHPQTASYSASARSTVLELGEPYWTVDVTVTLAQLSMKDYVHAWSAWWRRRRGQAVSFTMPRHFRRNGFSPHSDDSALQVLAYDDVNSTVTLKSGTDDYAVNLGDMIGYFTKKGSFYIAEVVVGAESVGGQVTISVEPPPYEPHPTDANPRRIDALGEFRLIDAVDWQEAYKDNELSFQARQLLREDLGAITAVYNPPANPPYMGY